MRLLNLMVASLALLAFTSAFADDTTTVAPVPIATDNVDVGALLKEVTALRTAVGQAKSTGDSHTLFLAVAGGLALLLKFAVSGLKKIPEDELSDKAKNVIPVALTVAGGLTVVLTHYAANEGWTNSIILGGAAPGAVLAHELWGALVGLLKKKPPVVSSGSALAPATPVEPPKAA